MVAGGRFDETHDGAVERRAMKLAEAITAECALAAAVPFGRRGERRHEGDAERHK